MKLVYLFFLSFFIFSCDSNSNEDKIRESFATYKKGMLENNPELAISKLHSNTFDYFEDILFIVKEDDSIEVSKIPPYEKSIVLLTRHMLSVNEINNISGQELLKFILTEDISDRSGISNLSIGEITITEDLALGEILIKDEPSVFNYKFYQVNSEWSLDLTSHIQLVNDVINNTIKESGKDMITTTLFSNLYTISDKLVDSTIWIPTDLR